MSFKKLQCGGEYSSLLSDCLHRNSCLVSESAAFYVRHCRRRNDLFESFIATFVGARLQKNCFTQRKYCALRNYFILMNYSVRGVYFILQSLRSLFMQRNSRFLGVFISVDLFSTEKKMFIQNIFASIKFIIINIIIYNYLFIQWNHCILELLSPVNLSS